MLWAKEEKRNKELEENRKAREKKKIGRFHFVI